MSKQRDASGEVVSAVKNNPSSRVYAEQVKLLYKQIPTGLLGESVVATFLCVALWHVFPHWQVISWMLYIYVASGLSRSLTVHYFNKQQTSLSMKQWARLFALGAFLSGVGWGFAGAFYINTPELLHQSVVVFILLGVTAAASSFYAIMMGIYILFLLPAMLPFTIWLFAQGDSYVMLGFGSLIYISAMIASTFYSSQLLKCALGLQFEILDLDSDNKKLEKKVAERTLALEKALDFTKSTLESTTDGIIMVDSRGMVEYFNQKFLSMWHLSRKNILNQHYKVVVKLVLDQLKKPEEFMRSIEDIYNNKNRESFIELQFIDNKVFECYSRPHWRSGEIIGHVWSFRDVTSRNKLTYRANHDQLTELPNRALFYDRIEQGIVFARRRHTSLTLLFIDLDDFKTINDTLGHSAGDLLLMEIAARLKESIRDSDTVARFGGDEFVILLMETEQGSLLNLTQALLRKIMQPIKLPSQEAITTASIGISIYPKDGDNAMTLLKNADMAMYLAKKKGRNNFQFYNEDIYQQSLEQLQIQTDLYNALTHNEFFLEYQPIISLSKFAITGAEALIRWHHPKRGVLYPADFLDIAEKNGLVTQLGAWVFREACQQIRRWHDAGLIISMSINISCAQMKGDTFIQTVEDALAEFGIDAQYLELEFTEKALMENIDQIRATLSRFRKMGIQMAIDDFGMGYSSMNYLKAFPINKLKIDRSFIENCMTSINDQSIIKAIISMGKNLSFTVLAEGVETRKQLQFLQENHCDEVQGNYFSQSVDEKSFPELLGRTDFWFNHRKTGKHVR